MRSVAPALLPAAALIAVLLTGEGRPSRAYIDIPLPSLADLCRDTNRGTEAIAVLRVEKVNREKRGIAYRKVRDLKGSFPAGRKYFGDTFTHIIHDSPNDWLMFKPHNHMDADRLELQNQAILAWAAEGKTAVLFERGGEQAICVGHLWYTARPAVSGNRGPYRSDRENPPEREQWVYGGASDPRFARFFCGDVDELVPAVTDILAGKQDVVAPRMVGTAQTVSDRSGPVLRFPADRAEFGDRGAFTPDARPRKEYYNPFGDQAAWSTHRGNPQRTGSDDGPGPKAPRVLWVHKTDEQFVAPLVPGAGQLYASGLGALNSPALHALALDPAGDDRVRWTKGAPLLRLPTTAAPALLAGPPDLLVFGDGSHTDEGASLRCLRAADGFPLWQLPVPGQLVHFEGTPTAAAGRVYVGGGNAGVLCLDPRRPTPRRVWQQGQDRWHVDAPVAVVEDRVLAASAYLDDEKLGERALFCLQAGDGEVLWKALLRLNPWAGPTVGPYALVGCSSVRLDPKAVAGATGEVVAVDLDSGKVKWRKDVPGGVLSSVAVKAGLAVFTATDGKVRAWDAFTGQEKWTYHARAPFFAGPAVTDRTVYAADLKGMVHALYLADGKQDWVLDLAADPATRTPGQVHGSPVVQGGRLYLATCNPGDTRGPAANVVVCVGDR
jgi:outer membrane protein assembly factor BamB